MTVTGSSSVPYYYDPYSSYPQCREESETVCISESCAASYIDSEPERTQSFTVSENNHQGYVDAAREGAVEGATAIFRILTGCSLMAGPPDRDDAGTDVLEEDGYDYFEDGDVVDEDGNGIPDEWEVPPDDGHEVDADGDADEVGDDGETDEGAVCTPQPPIVETLFTSGVLNNTIYDTESGALILRNAWTCEWEANSGLRPDEVAAPCAWALINPGGGIADLTTDPGNPPGTGPTTGWPAMHMSSIGREDQLRYQIVPAGLINPLGWVVEGIVRLENNEAAADAGACAFDISDFDGSSGTSLAIEIFNDRVRTVFQPGIVGQLMNTRDTAHSYRIAGRDNDFQVVIDAGVYTVDGTDLMTRPGVRSLVDWGDFAGADDSESYWFAFRYYNGGTSVPYDPFGTYEGTYDLGSSGNNLGTGAYISYSSTPPADTNITFETRSGDPTEADCSGPITWLNSWAPISGFGGIISSSTTSAQCLGVRVRLNASSGDTISPELREFAINYCSY